MDFQSNTIPDNSLAAVRRSLADIQEQPKPKYVPPCRRRKPPPTDNDEEDDHLTNHKKQRYWNSYEEMYIVELWRRYRDEVTEYNRPLPVHRKIMVSMRQKEMMVTGQDCRRKLNTLNNRYKTELDRLKLTGNKSDWRLFPLIHCLKSPKIKQFDPWHETLVVRKLLEKIPKPAEPKPPEPTPAPTLKPALPQQMPVRLPLAAATHQSTNGGSSSLVSATKSLMNGMNTILSVDHSSTSAIPRLHLSTVKSIIPFRRITLQKYEQLKIDNALMARQRDDDLKSVNTAEKNVNMMANILQNLNDLMSLENGIHIENEENKSVEQIRNGK